MLLCSTSKTQLLAADVLTHGQLRTARKKHQIDPDWIERYGDLVIWRFGDDLIGMYEMKWLDLGSQNSGEVKSLEFDTRDAAHQWKVSKWRNFNRWHMDNRWRHMDISMKNCVNSQLLYIHRSLVVIMSICLHKSVSNNSQVSQDFGSSTC